MRVFFENLSSQVACLNINQKIELCLVPGETKSIIVQKNDISIVIRPNYSCNILSSFLKSDRYHLVVETSYSFDNIREDSHFCIRREKIQFAYNAYYDRMFVFLGNVVPYRQEHRIFGEELVKKHYNKDRYISMFLIDPFLSSISGNIFFFILGIALWLWKGWLAGILCWFAGYWFHFFCAACSCALANAFFTVSQSSNTNKKTFFSYFDPKHIKEYYANPHRQPFDGKVEN